jgi:hypothetical protein
VRGYLAYKSSLAELILRNDAAFPVFAGDSSLDAKTRNGWSRLSLARPMIPVRGAFGTLMGDQQRLESGEGPGRRLEA